MAESRIISLSQAARSSELGPLVVNLLGAERDEGADETAQYKFVRHQSSLQYPDGMRMSEQYRPAIAAVLFVITYSVPLTGQPKPRARDLGVPFEGTPGPSNGIVDVAGVEVGHKTLISGEAVRTGVTAIWPRGKQSSDPVFGGWFSQNGNGEMTGTPWLEESGFADGPILITNTHSVGVARDSYLGWLVKNKRSPGTNVFPVASILTRSWRKLTMARRAARHITARTRL